MRRIGSMVWGVAILAAPLFYLPAPAQAELVVNISKSQQQLEVVVDGTQAYRWPVSTGRRGYQTPVGTYRPVRLERQWYSRKYNMTPMPYSVFFYRGYAVHGTMESRNLGRAVSHGCVRLRPDNASILYALVRRHGVRNTKLVVLNGPLPQAPRGPQQGVPMAAAEKPAMLPRQAPAKATAVEAQEHLSAKVRDVLQEAPRRLPQARHRAVSLARGDEAHVVRDREAWLRSLDRKYGLSR